MIKAPEQLATSRLLLRMPATDDAEAIFSRYANDATVCRYVGWPRHTSLDDTMAFLDFSRTEWHRWPAGPYLILKDGELIGSTGLGFESSAVASTGYVLASAHWGKGFASEALRAMLSLANDLEVSCLFALCHPDHRPSRSVLEKAGFQRDSSRIDTLFPNLNDGERAPAVRYSHTLASGGQ